MLTHLLWFNVGEVTNYLKIAGVEIREREFLSKREIDSLAISDRCRSSYLPKLKIVESLKKDGEI
jgi:hypothetical protein